MRPTTGTFVAAPWPLLDFGQPLKQHSSKSRGPQTDGPSTCTELVIAIFGVFHSFWFIDSESIVCGWWP